MKPSRGWMLAWIAVVCLLWNLVLQASMNPASSFEKHSVWPKESRSPSSCQSMRVLRGGWIHSRAGPQEFLFTPDVSLRAEDLDPAGPPWLESRGPPGIYRDLGRPIGLAVAKVATAAFIERSNYASAPNFPAVGRPNLKHGVLVESRRGAVPLASRWRLARFSPRRLSPVWRGSVSSSRSSHRTCGFPASGARRELTVSPTEGWRSVR